MSLAESIKQRLLNLAHEKADPFDLTLTRYGLERLLYRISQSQWECNFLLKGAIVLKSFMEGLSIDDLRLIYWSKQDAVFRFHVFSNRLTP
jgi:hypothetical protein